MRKAKTVVERRVVLVLGMHRSGTSAITRLVNMLGADIGDRLVPPGYDNPTGFWEHSEVVRINEQLLKGLGRTWYDMREMPSDWVDSDAGKLAFEQAAQLVRSDFGDSRLCVVKDPRICLTAQVWVNAFRAVGFDAACVFVIRNPREVVDSLHRRNDWPRASLYLMWVQYLLEAAAQTRGCVRSLTTYDRVLADWRGEMTRIGNDLGLKWPVGFDAAAPDIDRFLDPGQKHHQAAPNGEGSTRSHSTLPALVDGLYEKCLALADGNDEWEAIVEQREGFRKASELYTAHIDRLFTERWDAEERAQTAESRLTEQESTVAVVQREVQQSREILEARLDQNDQNVDGVHRLLVQTQDGLSTRLDEFRDSVQQQQEALGAIEARLQRQQALLNTALLRLEQLDGSYAVLGSHGERLDELRTVLGTHGSALGAIDAMLRTELQALRHARELSDARFAGVTASTSWRLTKPLRWLSVHVLRRPPEA